MSNFKCTAAGDSMVFRRFPGEYEGFKELKDFIAKGDMRFFNLETTVHDFETFGNELSGGSWFCAEPRVLSDMHNFGFNILTTANNHALDYGVDGLIKTLEYVKKEDFPASGTGKNLAEASAPAYLDTLAGRFALLSCTTSYTPGSTAGEQTRYMEGRPGVNAIGSTTTYKVKEEDIETIRRIALETGINGAADISRKEGYLPPLPESVAMLGSVRFEKGEESGKSTKLNKRDLDRMVNAVKDARFFADYVAVSIHSHEIKFVSKEEPAEHFEALAHALIDAGADVIIGTGPHLIRPIEIYNGKPIFYSIGDFILQNETMKFVPDGMYLKQGMTGNENMCDMYDKRSDGGKKGLYYTRKMFEAIVPFWEVKDGKLTEITLMPIDLGFGEPRSTGGLPRPAFDKGIIERLAEMSKPYGTEITIDENGFGKVKL